MPLADLPQMPQMPQAGYLRRAAQPRISAATAAPPYRGAASAARSGGPEVKISRLAFAKICTGKSCTSGVYALCDLNGDIRYVGSSRDIERRYVNHFGPTTGARGRAKRTWLIGLEAAGFMPGLEILEEIPNITDLPAAEARWIKALSICCDLEFQLNRKAPCRGTLRRDELLQRLAEYERRYGPL